MRPDLLATNIEEDLKNGYRPMAVVATIGTTSTTSIDPVHEIGVICRKHNIWFHVDGAYGGMYSIIPEYSDLTERFEYVDSYVTNPHKCLYVPIDLSMFYFRKPEIVKRAFSIVPEYLTTPESSEVTDYMNYGIQLGRSFRAVKLWFVLRYFGRLGIINRLRENIRLGRLMKSLVEEHKKFELMAPVPFSTVCFRYNPGLENEEKIAEINEKFMNNVNNTGEIFISHTKLKGKYSLRFAIGNIKTTEMHIKNAWRLFCKYAYERKRKR
jgi:aromatic-L-amino-acid decarboxylase